MYISTIPTRPRRFFSFRSRALLDTSIQYNNAVDYLRSGSEVQVRCAGDEMNKSILAG